MNLRDKIISRIESDILAEIKALTSNRGVENIEEYRRRLGIIKGMEMAMVHVTETFRGALEDNDDNEQSLFIN